MNNLPIPNLINRYEEIHLFKYASLLNNFIVENEDKNQLYLCLSAPQNGGKTSVLKMVCNFFSVNSDKYIIVNYTSWDYYCSDILWISVMYKMFKKIRMHKDIGFFYFYLCKFCYQFRLVRFLLLSLLSMFLVVLLYLINFDVTVTLNLFVMSMSTIFLYSVFSVYLSYSLLSVFKSFNYKLNFNVLNRLIEYDIKFFVSKLLKKKKKKLILFIDDLDKFDDALQSDFLLFINLLRNRTSLSVVIVFSFDIEIMSKMSTNFIRDDIFSYIDCMMDLVIYIPRIPLNISIPKKTIFDVYRYSYYNIPILGHYEQDCHLPNEQDIVFSIKKKYNVLLFDFENYDLLKYEICQNYHFLHKLWVNLNYRKNVGGILLNESEKYIFDSFYRLSSTNNSRNKKIIVLYNLSKFLIDDDIDREVVLKLTFLFEIFPCRMCILYHLIYCDTLYDINDSIVDTVEDLICSRYPYNDIISLNRRDLNLFLFRKYLKLLKIDKKVFFDTIPYILNINYSLKNYLESFL
jgi:hypothetical protein